MSLSEDSSADRLYEKGSDACRPFPLAPADGGLGATDKSAHVRHCATAGFSRGPGEPGQSHDAAMKPGQLAERRAVIRRSRARSRKPITPWSGSSRPVCHSDLHVARGDRGHQAAGGLGHEGIGVVESVGAGAERHVPQGHRVIFGFGGMGGCWCGAACNVWAVNLSSVRGAGYCSGPSRS